jgi:hypothetical protein
MEVTQIILVLKSGKPPNELTSYRPINLLPIVYKVFEKHLQTGYSLRSQITNQYLNINSDSDKDTAQ